MLEQELELSGEDWTITSARVPHWRHMVLNCVAHLRKQGLMLEHDRKQPDIWALSASGVAWARALLKA
jgi:hypothetical protein